jgi:hypothetical protein
LTSELYSLINFCNERPGKASPFEEGAGSKEPLQSLPKDGNNGRYALKGCELRQRLAT